MMDLELTRIFVKIAQVGSFTRAAAILNLPKSTVSKAVSRLERLSGTQLLSRTTRSLTLTAAGRAFYDSTLEPLLLIEDAQKSLHGQDSMLSGLIRLTAPEDLGAVVISPLIAKLSISHPGLDFELLYSDEVLDLVKSGLDLAVRLGKVPPSSFKVKKCGQVVLVAVAAPAYLKKHQAPQHPKDLKNHSCLSISSQRMRREWTLQSTTKRLSVPVESRLVSNQMSSLRNMTLAGAGIALIPYFLCREDLQEGRLIRVLAEWQSPGIPVSLIMPSSSSRSARLKITVDHLHRSLTAVLS